MDMTPIIIGLLGLLILDLASWRWGANSIQGPENLEWERRRSWRGFAGHHES